MANKDIALQAKNYLYELNNTAHEYGFASTETWEFNLSSEAEKKAIEKKYYPVVFTEVDVESLPDLYTLIQVKYASSKSDIATKMDNKNLGKNKLFICAFNAERLQ